MTDPHTGVKRPVSSFFGMVESFVSGEPVRRIRSVCMDVMRNRRQAAAALIQGRATVMMTMTWLSTAASSGSS